MEANTVPAGGYFGRALVVDATDGSAVTLPLPDEVLRAYLGGAGLGTWLLHRLGPPGADPLGPEAPLAFVFSPLVGTPLTTSAKLAVVAKSPLTGLLTDALASSQFAIAGARPVTFAHVPVIGLRGADWWNAQGAPSAAGATHAGLKFFAVSGHVERPGVYCVPTGTTARELLDLAGGVAGGRELGAIQPGGASSNFIGPDQLDVELDFGTLAAAGSMLGSGALVVVAKGTDLLAAAVNVLRFFRDESCGKCVPCRVGSAKSHLMLTDLLASGGGTGFANTGDVSADVRELADVMRRTSICGLGQVALGPVSSDLKLGASQNGASRNGASQDNGPDGTSGSRHEG